MPQAHATRAVLDREELLRAVRPAALIAHESANIVKLQIGGDGDAGVTVSANAEVGDHVGAGRGRGRGRRDDDRVQRPLPRRRPDQRRPPTSSRSSSTGRSSPGVFKPVGDDRYVHVVMPVRTTS